MKKSLKLSLSRETLGLLTLTQVKGNIGTMTGGGCYGDTANRCTSPCHVSNPTCDSCVETCAPC